MYTHKIKTTHQTLFIGVLRNSPGAMAYMFSKQTLASVSIRQVVGICGAAGGIAVSAALVIRQNNLKTHAVFRTAAEQLQQAEVVRQLLGDGVSTSGIAGGYIDPIEGTAVITLPLSSASGTCGYARVEAEAEWVANQVADPSGDEASPEVKAKARWLLRHLEVSVDGRSDGVPPKPHLPNEDTDDDDNVTTIGSGSGTANHSATISASMSGPYVLYSTPANAALSGWAPPRTPPRFGTLPVPRWLSWLIPQVTAPPPLPPPLPYALLPSPCNPCQPPVLYSLPTPSLTPPPPPPPPPTSPKSS